LGGHLGRTPPPSSGIPFPYIRWGAKGWRNPRQLRGELLSPSPMRLHLSLSRFLSRAWFLEDICTRVDSITVHHHDVGVPIQKIYFHILGWIRELGVVAKHHTCAKPRRCFHLWHLLFYEDHLDPDVSDEVQLHHPYSSGMLTAYSLRGHVSGIFPLHHYSHIDLGNPCTLVGKKYFFLRTPLDVPLNLCTSMLTSTPVSNHK
jgi:hypothetical protein